MNVLIASLLIVLPFDAFAEGGGMIHGTVVSRENRQPLVGANVVLQRTVLGTATHVDGMFTLKNVPAGVYTLAVSLIGYERQLVEGVRVEEEQTTELLIELSPMPIQTEPVVVTASKREQSLQEVPVSVSVLEAQELSYRNSISIDDALRYVPGVNMIQGQVNVRGSTGYSRGVGTRVLLLVDGLPLLTGDTGEIIWESIPVYQIDRVEVVKGAGSALYGSSALGGVINILTKEIKDEPETYVRVYGGMYEKPKYPQWRWTQQSRMFNGVFASHAARFNDVGVFIGGSRTSDEGFKRNDFWRRYNGSVRLMYNFSAFESGGLMFSLLDQRRGNFFYWKSLDSALVPPDNQLNQKVHSSRWSLGAYFKQFLSEQFSYTVKTSWYRTLWEDNISEGFDPDGHRSTAGFLNGEVQATHRLADVHVLTYGLYGTSNTVSADTIFGNRSGFGVAVYVQDEVTLADRLRLTVGGRLDVQKIDTVPAFNQFNPKVGIVFPVDGSTTVRASVGRGFRAPTVAEMFTTTQSGGLTILPNPSLRPERSLSVEIGGSHILSENIFFQTAFFHNEFWDLIEPRLNGVVRFHNVTRARVQGFETGFNVNLLNNGLQFDGGYTYTYARDINERAALKYRPRHILYLSARLRFNDLQFGIDQRYLSRVEKIDDELVRSSNNPLGPVVQGDRRVPIYVTDVRLSADWTFLDLPFVSSFHINNLFGYHYVELIGNIASMRNYVLTLEANL